MIPLTLVGSYSRVLARVNRLNPPSLKDKARKVLGWVGCSPIPLTIQEIQQALTINLDDKERQAIILAPLNIVKMCGPIVEVVDDYVQFVHFTVKE